MSIWDVNELVSTNVAIYFPSPIQYFIVFRQCRCDFAPRADKTLLLLMRPDSLGVTLFAVKF